MNKTVARILWITAGALMAIVGTVCICVPEITTKVLALVFGLTLLVSGIVDIVIFAKYNRFLLGAGWFLADGILTVILSLILLFNMTFTAVALPFVFGIWLIFTGINRFVSSFELKKFGVRGWGLITATGVLLALIGFLALLDPVFGAFTIATLTGILLIIKGASMIVQAIFAGRYFHI